MACQSTLKSRFGKWLVRAAGIEPAQALPPVESYTENPTCWPSRFPSCFNPKIFALEVYGERPAKTSYAAALKRSKRKASRSRSGR
jgi:hypothetical protein